MAIKSIATFFFLLVSISLVNGDAKESFVSSEICPDMIPVPPAKTLSVKYPDDTYVNEGNILNVTQVCDQPTVHWDCEDGVMYTLAMVDPDVPSREAPAHAQFVHWLVHNIPGCDVTRGDSLAPYFPPATTPGTPHRYTFLLYQQPATIDPELMPTVDGVKRMLFNLQHFVEKHDLGNPIAGNFFNGVCDVNNIVTL